MPLAAPSHKPHQPKGTKVVEEPKRLKTSERGYGWRWQQARLVHLRGEPLCRECRKAGRATQGTDVDHIIPHKGNGQLFWLRSNWQTLCASHHSEKTSRENGGWGNPQGMGGGKK
jgi:5-methylcytosine-specific restriction protein A